MFEDIFKRKKMIPEKLCAYGFIQNGDCFQYRTNIMDDSFTLYLCIRANETPDTRLVEVENGEEYVLYKTKASGAYIGEIRLAIEAVLKDIAVKCYETAVFQAEQTGLVIQHVRNVYGDELEFLWEKSPNNAIWRRKDNKKWYGAILTIPKNRLGFDADELVEIIDLRIQPEKMEELLMGENYYPGWHMNKMHWFTMILDGSVETEEICERIRVSYELAKK